MCLNEHANQLFVKQVPILRILFYICSLIENYEENICKKYFKRFLGETS